MPWQGNSEIMIDRFDVRAHLDYIPEVAKSESYPDESRDMRPTNYERYRILIQNSFLKGKIVLQVIIENSKSIVFMMQSKKKNSSRPLL